MQIQYKANFTKLNGLDHDHKFDSCVLTISVGQRVHEGEKFKAALELVNRKFKKCTVAVCDTLQRHSFAVLSNLDGDELHNVSKQCGDQWINRNIEYCEQILKIPFKIIRWDEWLQTDEYKIFRRQIDKLYKQDDKFSNIVNSLAIEFNDRLKNRGNNFDSSRGVRLSIEYILEECAAMCQWYEEGYDVDIYPSGRNEAIEYSFSVIMADYYGKLVLPASLNFKKNHTQDYLTSEVTIKKILDVIPGHVYWKDLEGTFLGCNKRQAENYGFKDEAKIIGKKDRDFLKEEVAKEIRANDKKIISTGSEEIVEEDTYILQDNKRIKKTFLSHKMPMFEKSGKIIGIVGVSIDISEQKKLQRGLSKKTKELSLALDHKREFLNVLSHEIRTPLHIMGSIINELHNNIHSFSSEELSSFITALYENSKRLMKLLTHLLDSAKSIKGQSNYIFKKNNLVTTCVSCIEEFHNLADITFVCNDKELLSCYDEIKISQIFRNVIDNAIKYGTDNKVRLVLQTVNDHKDILVKIENKGEKIAEEEKSKLFVMFYQGAKAREMQNGVGLGLSICREIIEAHKGKIWVENAVDNVISVNFTIPYNG
jgi:PAS domain S-box-containing protein